MSAFPPVFVIEQTLADTVRLVMGLRLLQGAVRRSVLREFTVSIGITNRWSCFVCHHHCRPVLLLRKSLNVQAAWHTFEKPGGIGF
jgi:hypothetical protein